MWKIEGSRGLKRSAMENEKWRFLCETLTEIKRGERQKGKVSVKNTEMTWEKMDRVIGRCEKTKKGHTARNRRTVKGE